MTILLCIDALHIDIDKNNTDILIVPAASPSDGFFQNKFESYLSKDIPTVFCNFCSYGGSTIYCQVPSGRNIAYGDTTHITKAAKKEEFVAIVDIEKKSQTTKVHSINTEIPVQVLSVKPILYRDHNAKQHNWLNVRDLCKQKNYSGIANAISLLEEAENGILQQKKKYLLAGLREQTIGFEEIQAATEFIYINDYTLAQYEINWLEKIINTFTVSITENKVDATKIMEPFSRLSSALQNILPVVTEKVDIPVFESIEQSNSVFQNRGGEIQHFVDVQHNRYKTIFVVQGFSQIGKSAFVDRVSLLYSFKLINCPIPKGGGFESLIRGICKVANLSPDWEDLDEETIRNYAGQFAHYLCNLNKSIAVFRTTGNLFSSHDTKNSVLFFKCLAEQLFELKTGIKLIIENSRMLPNSISEHPYIEVCKLKRIYDMYIGRLIEQTANNITYSLSLPQVNPQVVRRCDGNPSIARMVGICIGQKINLGENGDLLPDELEAFHDQYVKGILKILNVQPEEEAFLIEASIYRLEVPRKAFMMLPHYSDQTFDALLNKLLLDNCKDWYFVNSLIAGTLRRTAEKDTGLHAIAASYFDSEYKENPSSVAKAEYLFHLSSSGAKLPTKENLKYYANDILDAAIELFRNGEIEVAESHLKLISYYKQHCNWVEFNFYYALCHIINSDYAGYHELFNQAVAGAKKKTVLYFRMIDWLIKLRFLNEAENLLNEVGDIDSSSRQLKALWISLWYATYQTRDKAISEAQNLTKNTLGEFYSSRILVRIYRRECMKQDAMKEVQDVLKSWPNNRWAKEMRRLIITGFSGDQDDELFDESDLADYE